MKTLANIKFNDKEVEELEDKVCSDTSYFIVKYKTIYQLKYSNNAGLYTIEVYKDRDLGGIGYVKRGRFLITTASQVNDLIGKEIFN